MSTQPRDGDHLTDHDHDYDHDSAATAEPPATSSGPQLRPPAAPAPALASSSTSIFVAALWAAVGGNDGSDPDNKVDLIPVIQTRSGKPQQVPSLAPGVGQAVTETAAWLQREHGVGLHHVVGVAVHGASVCVQLVVVVLALFRLRATYLPLASAGSTPRASPTHSELSCGERDDPNHAADLKKKAETAGCNWLISLLGPSSSSELLQPDMHTQLKVYELGPAPTSSQFCNDIDDNDHIAYTVHTSGTTDPANRTRVSVPFSSFATHIAEIGQVWPTDPSTTKIALTTPPTFDPHLIELFHAIRWNLPLVIAPRLSDAINAGATLLSTTPSRLFLELDRDAISNILEGMTTITHLFLGGEPFPVARLHALVCMDRWRIEVANLYGTTENSVWAGCHVLRPNEWKELYLTRGVPVNPALKWTEIKVDVERGGAVTVGGEWRKCFVNGRQACFDRTNDAASFIDGHHIVVHGRIDRQIKRHGHRIQLELIESLAHSTPPIHDETDTFAIEHAIAIHNPLTSTLTLTIHPPSFPIDRIWSHLRATCPAHSIPDEIVHIYSVPLTANGKVNGRAIAQLVFSSQRGSIEPLAAIQQVLPPNSAADRDSTQSYFTQLGGDSLSAVRVIRLLTRHLESSSSSNPSLDALQTQLFHSLMHAPVSTFMQMCDQVVPTSTSAVISKRSRSPPSSSHTSSLAPVSKRIRPAPAITLTRVADLGKCIDAPPLLVATTQTDASTPHVLVGSHAGHWCAYACSSRIPPAVHTLPGAPRIEAGMLVHPLRADMVLIPTLAGTLYCCAWRTGAVVHMWDLGGGEPIKCQPAADAEGRVWVGTHAGRVYAGHPNMDGGMEWGDGWDVGGAVGARVVFHDGFAYAATTAGCLVCINANDPSTTHWSTQLAGPMFATPLVIPTTNTALVCTARSIALVSLTSGAVMRERSPIPHPIFSAPVWIAQWQLVAFGTHGNQVQVVDPESLAVVVVMNFDAPVFANVMLVPDGEQEERVRMVVAVTDGTLVDVTLERLEEEEEGGQVVVSEIGRVECQLPGQVFSSPCLVPTVDGGALRVVAGCRDNGLYQCTLP